MAITEIRKDGIKGYLVRVSSSSSRDPSIRVRMQDVLLGETKAKAIVVQKQLRKVAKEEVRRREEEGLLFAQLISTWKQRELMVKPQETVTLGDYERALSIYTKSISSIPVAKINSGHIEDIYAQMSKLGKSRSRMRAVRSAINSLYAWSHCEGLIGRDILSPAQGARLPKGAKKEQPILNREEILYFLAKAKEAQHFLYEPWALGFLTGMRSGELAALKWTDVDFDRNLITVSKSYNSRLDRVKSTKSGLSRQVPINTELRSFLQSLKLKAAQRNGNVLEHTSAWRRGEAARFTREFCKLIGIREINFHATRACWAVQCLEAGISVPKVMRIGGWQSFKSFQHYLRLSGVEIRDAMEAMGSILPAPANAQILSFSSVLAPT